MKGKYLILWLLVFFALLIITLYCVATQNHLLVKILGFLLVVLMLLGVILWRKENMYSRLKNRRISLTFENKKWLNEQIAFYRTLDKRNKVVFEDRIRLFLANVGVDNDDNSQDNMYRFYVASSAIIAFWGLPYYDYNGLKVVFLSNLKPAEVDLPDNIWINESELIAEFKKINSNTNFKAPDYDLFLSDENLSLNMETSAYHQNLWIPILSYQKANCIETNSFFYKAIQFYMQKHPDFLKEKNPSMFNLFDV